jgi:hypothetical protein
MGLTVACTVSLLRLGVGNGDAPHAPPHAAGEPSTTAAPIGVTTTAPEVAAPTTTRVARATMPLAEAKRAGLWGRPRFDGCTSRHGGASPEWLNAAIADSAWPREQWDKLCRVIGCESNFDAGALAWRRGGSLLGLLQIHSRSWRHAYEAQGFTDADLLQPAPNLAFGLWLWREVYGARWTTHAWSCARS